MFPIRSALFILLMLSLAASLGAQTGPQSVVLKMEPAFFVTGLRCAARCDPESYNPIRFPLHVATKALRGGSRVTGLPAFEAGECVVFMLCAADLDQWMFGRTATRWLNARRLIGLLLVLRRPRRIAEPFPFLPLGQFQQVIERSRRGVHPRRRRAGSRCRSLIRPPRRRDRGTPGGAAGCPRRWRARSRRGS